MDQKSLGQIRQIVNVAAETLRIEIVDAKRHTRVLTERLWHDLQLVAEGFQMHLDRRHADDRAHLVAQFRETRGRIERPPFYRARSASKEGTVPHPSSSF